MPSPILQVTDGPLQLNEPAGAQYGASFTFAGPTPSAPFDQSKYEYWVHATSQEVVFKDQTISSLANLGVSSTSCTDFVKYLKGTNGGPPSYAFNRFSRYLAKIADRPDLFGSNPNIPGYQTACHYQVQFQGSTGSTSFQGVLMRRWATNLRSAEEYWLLNRPNGKLAPGDSVTFAGQTSTSDAPKEIITTFPDLLPDPKTAGQLSTYFFWYNQLDWDTLDSDPKNWQSQVCGT